MQLEERVAAAVRAQTDDIGTWAPDVASIRRSAQVQTRRRVAASVGAVAIAVALATTAALLDPGPLDRSVPPIDRPEKTVDEIRVDKNGVMTIPRVRDEQLVVTPRVTSTVSPGRHLVASVSSDEASYDGSGELAVEFPAPGPDRVSFQASCNGAPAASFVVLMEPNATYYKSVPCDGEGVTLNDVGLDQRGMTLRAFVTEENTGDFRRCFNYSPPEGCDEPARATDSAATFGLSIYEYRPGPVAVRMFGGDVHARGAWQDGLYSLTKVAAGATGDSELSFRLDASSSERIAEATLGFTPAFYECVERAGDDESMSDSGCYPTEELLIDGQPGEEQRYGPFSGGAAWGALEPGKAHVITFRLVEGDPKYFDLGVLVYEED